MVFSLTPIPNSINLFINSSPSIKSICCFPALQASSLAALVKEPVVIRTPFSMSVVREPLKSLISAADTLPVYLLHWNATLKLNIPLILNLPEPSIPPSLDFFCYSNLRKSAFP